MSQQPSQYPPNYQPQPQYIQYPPQQQYNQQYPPQQSYYPPPPPQKPSFWTRKVGCMPMWVLIFFIVLFAAAGVRAAANNSTTTTLTDVQIAATNSAQIAATNGASTVDTPVPTATLDASIPTSTPAPTQPPAKWVTTHTYTGNGDKKTGTITVPNDWKIVWSCQGFTDGTGIAGSMYVSVYNSDTTPLDVNAVSANCKAGGWTSDNTEEHQGGDIYLDVTATGAWKITVQEFK